jgi:hypothetical protein
MTRRSPAIPRDSGAFEPLQVRFESTDRAFTFALKTGVARRIAYDLSDTFLAPDARLVCHASPREKSDSMEASDSLDFLGRLSIRAAAR